VTELNGYFKIPLPKLHDTLLFSSVSNEDYSVSVTEKLLKDTLLEVVLLDTHNSLADVVVARNGITIKKKDIGDVIGNITVKNYYGSFPSADKRIEYEFAAPLSIAESDISRLIRLPRKGCLHAFNKRHRNLNHVGYFVRTKNIFS
jgi:hypothetical protein